MKKFLYDMLDRVPALKNFLYDILILWPSWMFRKLTWILRTIAVFGISAYKYWFYSGKKKDIYSIVELRYHGKKVLLRSGSTDFLLAESILVGHYIGKGRYRGEYQQAYDYLREISKPVIIDAGSNVGLFSILFASAFPDAMIVALEPEKENYELLLKNTSGYKNIICLNKGLWSKTAKLQVIFGEDGEWGFRVNEIVNGEGEGVEGISINDIVKKYHLRIIDLLKMDIEGSEYEVLKNGNRDWLDICEGIVIETHDDIVPGVDKFVNDLLSKYKYKKACLEENQLFTKVSE